jgi:hypothetical protein
VLIIAFKLLITPLMIGMVTLAGRRWGSVVSGLLIGLPLTSGPISFILACEYGVDFAAQSAIGGMAGQISSCMFCLTYAHVGQRFNWPISIVLAIAAFLLSTTALNSFTWQLLPAFFSLLCCIVVVSRLIPLRPVQSKVSAPPRWDLPARIFTATTFVIVLTTVADALGPQLSGLLAPFPVFGIVFAAFTHSQQGAKVTSNLLRGIVVSSVGYATFFIVVGSFLTNLGIALTYLLAAVSAVSVSGMFYFTSREMKQ